MRGLSSMNSKVILAGCLSLSLLACSGEKSSSAISSIDFDGPVADWPTYGGGLEGRQFSPLTQVNRDNVSEMSVAWEYQFPPTNNVEVDDLLLQFQLQPIVVGDALYACTPTSRVFSLDANTGVERWFYDYAIQARPSKGYPIKCRGVAYWSAPVDEKKECSERIFVANPDALLIALDAKTGELCQGFGIEGKVFLYQNVEGYVAGEYGPTSAPIVVNNMVVVGARVDDNIKLKSPSGVVRAYDAVTGELRWDWNPVAPDVDPMITDSQGQTFYKAGTVNSWAPMSADESRGLVYVPTGNPSPDLYGGLRNGSDYYGSSVVALEVDSGKVRWHFQTVHHDVWDYDVPSIPALFQIPGVGDGKLALAQPTKLGHIFLLDRLSGEPLYPVEERAVPQGGWRERSCHRPSLFQLTPLPFIRWTLSLGALPPLTKNRVPKKLPAIVGMGYLHRQVLRALYSFPAALEG